MVLLHNDSFLGQLILLDLQITASLNVVPWDSAEALILSHS